MYVNKYLSWHKTEWLRLWDRSPELPHALLLAGPAGIGKHQFAMATAQRLLCEVPRGPAEPGCGECPSCRLLASGNHPDFRHVIPEADAEEAGTAIPTSDAKKASSQILIAQVRALEDFIYVGGHRGNRRAILIEPAEAMNVAAENALLKMLEEPPVGVCFILVSDRWRKLLPTIRSRCRTVMFGRPDGAQAAHWLAEQGSNEAVPLLALTGGAPLRALEEIKTGRAEILDKASASLFDQAGDFLALAERWEGLIKNDGGLKLDELVALIQKGLFDFASLKLAGRLRFFIGRERQAEGIAGRADLGGILSYYNDLHKARALSSHPLNTRLFLEDIAARYLRAIAPARA